MTSRLVSGGLAWLLCSPAALAGGSTPAPEKADEAAAQSVVQDLADELPSPYCPGRSIASCPTQAARELEADMVRQAKSGRTRDEIESELVARFGEETMGTPMRTELVIGVSLLGLLALFSLVRMGGRWSRGRGEGAVAARERGEGSETGADARPEKAGMTQAEHDRLDDELDRVREF